MSDVEKLVCEKKLIENKLSFLLHGSIEIRSRKAKKYVYVHFRNEGGLTTKYAGEYSIFLVNLIKNNTIFAKSYKKRLKEINKELTALNYLESNTIDEKIALNIDFATKHLPILIYNQSILEGIHATYFDIETIIDGGVVQGITSTNINKVINLKHAWRFTLSPNLANYPTNFVVLCQINQLVEDGFSLTAGRIRSEFVKIRGSAYLPPIPLESRVKEDLFSLLDKQPSIDVGIDLILYVMKKQLFLDGNKRTAIIFANYYLIRNALGLIVIPAEFVEEFKKLTIEYYEDENKKTVISTFLKEKCWIKME